KGVRSYRTGRFDKEHGCFHLIVTQWNGVTPLGLWVMVSIIGRLEGYHLSQEKIKVSAPIGPDVLIKSMGAFI
ncbi:hypothetical protein ACTQ45_13680, partial [Fundicoccus sp. Sow4_D5]|uniref:hypothetical protein n=1 Tax=Fundicoccus sp. Sow4_D5 TaxID=3438782 RepID=UPI003F928D6F